MLVASVYYKKVYANIRQVVKKYYKIKIDYRDLQSGFYGFLWCPTPCFYSIWGFFALQWDYFWRAKKPQLQCNGSLNGVQKWSFCNKRELFCVA